MGVNPSGSDALTGERLVEPPKQESIDASLLHQSEILYRGGENKDWMHIRGRGGGRQSSLSARVKILKPKKSK